MGGEFKWSFGMNYGVNYRLNYGRRLEWEFTLIILSAFHLINISCAKERVYRKNVNLIRHIPVKQIS